MSKTLMEMPCPECKDPVSYHIRDGKPTGCVMAEAGGGNCACDYFRRDRPGWVKWPSAGKTHWTNDGQTTICGFEVGGYGHQDFKYVKAPEWTKNYWGWTAQSKYRGPRYCGDCTRIWAVINKNVLPPVTPEERIELEAKVEADWREKANLP